MHQKLFVGWALRRTAHSTPSDSLPASGKGKKKKGETKEEK